MHRIAVISDIHGNMTAASAVLDDIGTRGIEDIICLGDLVGKGPHSPEAVDLMREKCRLIVRGNWDDFISNPTEDPTLRWHQMRLGEERLRYLKMLPLSVDLRLSGRLIRLYHASAKSIYHRVQPWEPIEERMAMFANTELTGTADDQAAEPDVVGYGDVHNAFVQHLNGRVLFNTGSVGNPLDVTQAAYAILEGDRASTGLKPFSIQLVRVPYDIEQAVRDAEELGMPSLDAYAKELRTAKYRGLKS
ncbi:metallophosphoesterase family protein [Paenibacillus chartarius]|uniref:Metallophosphoesterase family protein n=1 Tax=Paenibacillus chartarius TaxID=747481 RepID=A0ABV6DEW6_9BACL